MLRRLAPDILVSLAVAATAGWLLTGGSAWTFWASNVSLTWLLLPLWFGWRTGVALRGAVAGLVMTWACLAAYYLPVVTLMQGGDATYAARFGLRYVLLGSLSGPVLGAVGAWWRRHPVAVVPVCVAVAGVAERWAWRSRVGFDPSPAVFTVEACVATAIALVMFTWARGARAR